MTGASKLLRCLSCDLLTSDGLNPLYFLSRDEDMDGEWEAPQIPNPACESAPGCGTWKRPMIDNPSYKGKWKPPMIDNPNYQVCLVLSEKNAGSVQDASSNQNVCVPGHLEAQENPKPGLL